MNRESRELIQHRVRYGHAFRTEPLELPLFSLREERGLGV